MPLLNISDKTTFPKALCCCQEEIISTLPVAYRLVLCEWCPVFFPTFICWSCYWSFRSLNLACFTFTSPSWLRAALLLELTAQFCLFSSLITKDGWIVTVWLASHSDLCINVKSVSLKKKKSLSRLMSLHVALCLFLGLHLNSCVSHVQRVRCVCVDMPIDENVSAALLHKGSLPLNNAVPLL